MISDVWLQTNQYKTIQVLFSLTVKNTICVRYIDLYDHLNYCLATGIAPITAHLRGWEEQMTICGLPRSLASTV